MPKSQQKQTPWKWSDAKHGAARLLAEDELTDAEISARVGIRRQTLWAWKKRPEFTDRVSELADELGEVARRYAVARRSRRLRGYDDRREKMLAVIEQRGADPSMVQVPGGPTGLLCRTLKSIGGGDNAREVEEFEVDTGLLKELRELEKQVAVEVGQWTEKREVDSNSRVVMEVIEEVVSAPDG